MIALRVFVFLGAFLLFAMEPMVGRVLLPTYGGAFHVWTTSLMFFQGALFMGYLWAHVAAPKLGKLHFVLLGAALVLLPPAAHWVSDERSVGSLLLTLVASFALPFVALATTGVVSQAWLAQSDLPERTTPYRLYATSNLGSMLALFAYALLIEPLFGLSVQRVAWAALYLVYLGSAAWAYRATRRSAATRAASSEAKPTVEAEAKPEEQDAAPSAGRIAYWLLLSACPSAFLMAVTNLIALDAGNVPLVWVVPLALYLLTFVLAFAEPSRAPEWTRRLWPHFAAVGLFFFSGGETGGTWIQVFLQLAVLFVVCLAAHGELYASRPAPKRLTLYYLVVSGGGWIGGAFVALGAPLLFPGLWEYTISLVVLALGMAVARRQAIRAFMKESGVSIVIVTLALMGAIAWKLAAASDPRAATVRTLATQRSFYGLWYVLSRPSPRGVREHDLISGTTRHGRQLVDETLRREPLSYYARVGPAGDVFAMTAQTHAQRRVGVVGLGVGAVAAYARPRERFTFFEIDDAVVELAGRHFTYLADSEGEIEMVVGDARLSLARLAQTQGEPPFDLLMIDAFAGDAIPTHLVTREALELYLSLVPRDGGIVLMHVSNRYYDLRPVLATIARTLGIHAAWKRDTVPADRSLQDPSVYFVLSQDAAALEPLSARGFVPVTASDPVPTVLWTDDHSSALRALRLD